jgi:hypothetical protein
MRASEARVGWSAQKTPYKNTHTHTARTYNARTHHVCAEQAQRRAFGDACDKALGECHYHVDLAVQRCLHHGTRSLLYYDEFNLPKCQILQWSSHGCIKSGKISGEAVLPKDVNSNKRKHTYLNAMLLEDASLLCEFPRIIEVLGHACHANCTGDEPS